MSKRIETLEQLDELLSPDYRFTLSWGSDKNALEKMSWHLIQSLPFDLNIILIGTREWKDDIDREGLYAVEQIDARYARPTTTCAATSWTGCFPRHWRTWLLTWPAW